MILPVMFPNRCINFVILADISSHMEYKICPHCNKKLDGLMKSKFIIEQSTTDFINKFSLSPSEAYCSGCSEPLVEKCKADLSTLVKESIRVIPIVTTNSPLQWDYEVLGMVTGQSITGTGMISEFASSWSDLIGGQSNSLGEKIAHGEVLCKNPRKYKAATMGANAVIATDIDYSEVRGGREECLWSVWGAQQ